MGRLIEHRQYCAQDYENFTKRIHDQVDTLKEVISQPDFGKDQETKIVDWHFVLRPIYFGNWQLSSSL